MLDDQLFAVFVRGVCAGGNMAHLAPEILNANTRVQQPGTHERVSYAKQPVFEAGVLLFELITGHHPLGNYPNAQRDPVTSLITYNNGVGQIHDDYPGPLKDILPRMIAFNPADRPELEVVLIISVIHAFRTFCALSLLCQLACAVCTTYFVKTSVCGEKMMIYVVQSLDCVGKMTTCIKRKSVQQLQKHRSDVLGDANL